MDFLFKLSVSRRLVVLVGFAVAAMAVLVGVLMTSERAMLLRERQDSVRQAVETAHGILVHFHGLAAKGSMPEGGVPVVISADKNVKYEAVVRVMDTLQRAGVARVGLSVQTSR